MKEEWRDISESPDLYQISNLGNVRRKGCELCAHPIAARSQSQGYRQVSIYLPNGRQVSRMIHRLIAIAFIPNPKNKKEVNHKDGNKSNNSIGNLEWTTRSENANHAYALGLIKPSSGDMHWTRRHPEFKTESWRSKKLDFKTASEIRAAYKPRDPKNGGRALARFYGVSQRTVMDIVWGDTWRAS